MENDLISRNNATQMMWLCLNSCNEINKICVYAHAIKQIQKIPAVDAVPVVHGRWINKGAWHTECEKCGYVLETICMVKNYCPSCGTKMDGKETTK